MTPRPAISKMEKSEKGGDVLSPSPPFSPYNDYDALAAVKVKTAFARWANRALIFFLLLFSLSLPHSIAAAQTSLGICVLTWIVRDVAMRHIHFTRTPIDLPLLCFATLTIISSVFSIEPSLSMPKLKTLLLFGVIYLITTNLHPRGVRLFAAVLVLSSLVGVGFSLTEKVLGRGMVIAAIENDSPFAGSQLQPGDVIWMIAKRRVFTLEGAAYVIRQHQTEEVIDVEALHAGDPIPVKLTVSDELKARDNPLGISVSGRSRQFRISGFLRQFQTYAEQMQILALLVFGGLLTIVRLWRRRKMGIWFKLFCILFLLFGLALILTASRAVIGAFIMSILLVSISVGGRLAPTIAVVFVFVFGSVGYYVMTSARQQATMSFNDDSASRRIAYMKAGLNMIKKRPLLGTGMDSLKRHWQEWGFPGTYITHTHSTPIQISMDRGLPTLGCYVWLIVAMMVMCRRGYKRAKKRGDEIGESFMLGAFGALIGFTISSLANYNFGDSEVLMLLLSMIGLVVVRLRIYSKVAGEKSAGDIDSARESR